MEDSTSDLAQSILKKAGRPLHYKEITARIQKTKNLGGKRPHCSVNAVLCRDPRFAHVGKPRSGLYELIS